MGRGLGERRQDTGCMRSCLREQQRTRSRIEVVEGALITSGSGSALLPTQRFFRGLSLLWSRT